VEFLERTRRVIGLVFNRIEEKQEKLVTTKQRQELMDIIEFESVLKERIEDLNIKLKNSNNLRAFFYKNIALNLYIQFPYFATWMNRTIWVGLMIAALAVTATSTVIPASFASTERDSPQDGWGEVTSETATSDNNDDERADGLGEHSRAGSDATGEPPFDGGFDGDKGRAGIGNVAEAVTDPDQEDPGKNPNELGCTLAGIDNNPDTGC
jgi:hypothetical protein